MAAYWIVQIEVADPKAYEEYRKRSPAAVQKYGGRFIARGGRTEILEGDQIYPRLVIVEFPTFQQAVACYNSPEYKEAMSFRAGSANARIVAVEGV